MSKDARAQILLIHAATFAVAVAICAAVNLWLSPGRLWFVWVALGWGIGVAAHGLAFWLRHTRRRERVFVDRKARGFTIHLFAYVAVVVLLFVVNLTMTPKVWWFYWVALGWGAGVAFHGWCAFFRKRQSAQVGANPRRRWGRLRRDRHRASAEEPTPHAAKKTSPTKKRAARNKQASPRKRPRT